eukprot:6176360-Pleurochrysis_carterae.AAC.1
MVSIICGKQHHVKNSCQSDVSDWAAGDVPHILPSSTLAACLGIYRNESEDAVTGFPDCAMRETGLQFYQGFGDMSNTFAMVYQYNFFANPVNLPYIVIRHPCGNLSRGSKVSIYDTVQETCTSARSIWSTPILLAGGDSYPLGYVQILSSGYFGILVLRYELGQRDETVVSLNSRVILKHS